MNDIFRTLPPDIMKQRVEGYVQRRIEVHGASVVVRDASVLVENAAGRKGVSLAELLEFVELYSPCGKMHEWDYLLIYEMIPRWQIPRAMRTHTRLMMQGK